MVSENTFNFVIKESISDSISFLERLIDSSAPDTIQAKLYFGNLSFIELANFSLKPFLSFITLYNLSGLSIPNNVENNFTFPFASFPIISNNLSFLFIPKEKSIINKNTRKYCIFATYNNKVNINLIKNENLNAKH